MENEQITTSLPVIIRQDQHQHSHQDDHKILCCLCGIAITPNPANMCLSCIKGQVDISDTINKQEIIFFCRECERYLQPPKYWVKCDLESKELLSLCLKRIKGLNKVKLIDAQWLWTEPHSRRLKLKLTIQKEVFNGTLLQQTFIVDFIVKNQQCDTCQKSYTLNTWVANVQVRQKLDHKRTFLYLEQLIIKHHAQEQCINIKDEPDGIDFFFGHKSHANKFVDFIASVAPIKTKTSERLITHDAKSNIFNYKYSFSVELAPICREDLVCLPKKLANNLGGLGPVVLCSKVNQAIHFLDPQTLQMAELPNQFFWKHPFQSFMDYRQEVEFIVLDVEINPHVRKGKYMLCEAQIVKSDDIGNDNAIVFTKSHLGYILKPGTKVMGYDLRNIKLDDVSSHASTPEVVLTRKVHKKKTKSKHRKWKLKTLKKDEDKPLDKNDQIKLEKDYERFMEELEEDDELRKTINLYKVKNPIASASKKEDDETVSVSSATTSSSSVFGVKEDELIDEEEEERLRELQLREKELLGQSNRHTVDDDDDAVEQTEDAQ